MKKSITFFVLLISTLISTSCDDMLDINRDPDSLSPEGIVPATELPSAITGIAGAQGAEFAIIGGMWSQFWAQSPSASQYRTIDSYSINASNYQGGWNNMYDALGDIRNIKRIANETEDWNYYLIATVLETYGSQILADWYSDIPYSEANDLNNFAPMFNNGQEVYDLMIEDLNEALSKDLNQSTGTPPGQDDFIFGGDMAQWVKFANTLKLKIFMRQSNVRPNIAENGILSLPNNFLETDASLTQFIDEAGRSNPLYESDRRQLNVATNLRASITMYSYLSENADPRLSSYYGPGNPMSQGDFNSLTAPNSISVVTLSPTTPVYFISAEESYFLQAEAKVRFSGGSGAKELYDMGVLAAFSKWGLDGSSFISPGGNYEYPSSGTVEEQIEAIITQKWLSSFPGNGFESFFEQNRTGYPRESTVSQTDPAYIPGQLAYSVTGITGGIFPRRLEWPQDEIDRNPNSPEVIIDIIEPVWWAN